MVRGYVTKSKRPAGLKDPHIVAHHVGHGVRNTMLDERAASTIRFLRQGFNHILHTHAPAHRDVRLLAWRVAVVHLQTKPLTRILADGEAQHRIKLRQLETDGLASN